MVVASQNVGTQSYTNQTHVAALQAQTQTLASSITQGKHLGNISYVVNWCILRGIAHKTAIRPRCRRDSLCLSALAATRGTTGAQNAAPNLV